MGHSSSRDQVCAKDEPVLVPACLKVSASLKLERWCQHNRITLLSECWLDWESHVTRSEFVEAKGAVSAPLGETSCCQTGDIAPP